MSTTNVINDLGFEECICGRMAAKAHCPYCGSYDVYAQGRKHDELVHEPETGEPRRIASFRCKRCSMHFNQWQWQRYCTAPPYVWQARRLQQKQAEQLRDKEALRLTQKQQTLLSDPKILAYINKQRSKDGRPPLDESGKEILGVRVTNEYEAVKQGTVWRILNKTTDTFVGGEYQTENGARIDMEGLK